MSGHTPPSSFKSPGNCIPLVEPTECLLRLRRCCGGLVRAVHKHRGTCPWPCRLTLSVGGSGCLGVLPISWTLLIAHALLLCALTSGSTDETREIWTLVVWRSWVSLTLTTSLMATQTSPSNSTVWSILTQISWASAPCYSRLVATYMGRLNLVLIEAGPPCMASPLSSPSSKRIFPCHVSFIFFHPRCIHPYPRPSYGLALPLIPQSLVGLNLRGGCHCPSTLSAPAAASCWIC